MIIIKDGDYNKEIKAMHQVNEQEAAAAAASSTRKRNKLHVDNSNGLCDHCNYYQQIKVEKLAEFRPKNEVRIFFFVFFKLLNIYFKLHN